MESGRLRVRSPEGDERAAGIGAKGVDFEATYHVRIDPHDLGLTVGPTVFEPSPTPPANPDATIASDSVTLTNLFNAGLTLHDAEASGRLHIDGDRPLALAVLDKLTLGPGTD